MRSYKDLTLEEINYLIGVLKGYSYQEASKFIPIGTSIKLYDPFEKPYDKAYKCLKQLDLLDTYELKPEDKLLLQEAEIKKLKEELEIYKTHPMYVINCVPVMSSGVFSGNTVWLDPKDNESIVGDPVLVTGRYTQR